MGFTTRGQLKFMDFHVKTLKFKLFLLKGEIKGYLGCQLLIKGLCFHVVRKKCVISVCG